MIGGTAFLLGLIGLGTAKTADVVSSIRAAAYQPAKISHRQCVIHEVICQSGRTYDGECEIWRLAKNRKIMVSDAEEIATELQCMIEGIEYVAPKRNDIFRSYTDIYGKPSGAEVANMIIRNRKNRRL